MVLLNFAFAIGGMLLASESGLVFTNRLHEEGWAGCPETDATVLSASVCTRDGRDCPHVACVIYVYQVQNENYSGLCVKPFLSGQEALEFVEKCYARIPTTKYRPEYPQESCLIVEF